MANDKIRSVIDEVINERVKQDNKWGGPAHDDEHTTSEFASFIRDRASTSPSRNDLIQIAALAIAAVESMDRRTS